jgi:dTDP-4-dehydrorhamnose 3,5-epimerase
MDKKNIDGLILTKENQFHNEQGSIFHFLKKSNINFTQFGEVYFSTIYKNVEKGWRLHKLATSNIVVISGRIEFTFEDPRPNSSSYNFTKKILLSPENYHRITIPPGIWWKFKGLDSLNILSNFSDLEHDPKESISR